MTDQINRVPDMLLELYLLEELSDEQMREVELRLGEEPDGQARLAALRASNEAILDEYPVMDMARKIEHAAQRARFEQARKPMVDTSKRLELFVAAAVLILGSSAVAFFAYRGSGGAESAEHVVNKPVVGGSMLPGQTGAGEDLATSPSDDEEEGPDPYDSRNERARELRDKLERGAPVKEEDVDTTGLILAMERKANRALIRGDREAAVDTCESARELEASACPWLDQALAKFDAEGPESIEEPENLSVDDIETPDAERGEELFEEATTSMLKGDFRDAIKRCRAGLAHGEGRCNRVLGISYKNVGDDRRACLHFKRIGLDGHDGLVCD